MQRQDIEEKFAKCYVCANGLSYMDNLLYGNRCVFCVEKGKNMPLMQFLRLAYYDWRIYQVLMRLKSNGNGKDAWAQYMGALQVTGKTDINMLETVKDRKELLRELRKM